MAQHTPLMGLDFFDESAAVIYSQTLSSPLRIHLPRHRPPLNHKM